ncbi:hypothetical protein C2869_03795 [Saccharobesus litoralis]|uniref:Solute-binding protein family 3/N-terminal domain-containing protein n=1 Tax=Saccharobesus litoralis TaxID=2172099 RepID=A0A2S0VN56_9ALTE|nr:hypothetical protein [Saccharobesus litoralis]AWB65612.1 hypothetical protein C2869_03795 [Saccharobesus litoralis]
MLVCRLVIRLFTLYIRALFVSALFICVFSLNVARAEVTLTSPSGISEIRQKYVYDLLVLALKETTSASQETRVTSIPTNTGYSASTYAVKKGKVDVTYFPANTEVETQLLPIRIPLYKGLMGYRTLLIQAKNQSKFDNLHSLKQFKNILQGAGSRWRTTKVLAHHEFKYITAERTSSLLKMLDIGRFEYTTRGIIETPETLQAIDKNYPKLKIEDNTIFYTELPVYFFVSKQRPELAKKIYTGLVKAAHNGEFDKVFDAFYQMIPSGLNFDKRNFYYLKNPQLSAETRANALNFWQKQVKSPVFKTVHFSH